MGTVYLRSGRILVIAVVLSLLAGIAFTAAGTYILSNNLSLTKNGYSTEGTVISLKEHRSTNAKSPGTSSRSYRPEIEFTTYNNLTMRIVYPNGSNPPAYSVGQKIKILYSKDNPENFVIHSSFEVFGLPLIFISIGVLCLIIGSGLIIVKKFK